MKYRILKLGEYHERYKVQFRAWYWPKWFDIGNCEDSLEEAHEAIRRYRKPKYIVVYEEKDEKTESVLLRPSEKSD